jgi:hypothetical protein
MALMLVYLTPGRTPCVALPNFCSKPVVTRLGNTLGTASYLRRKRDQDDRFVPRSSSARRAKRGAQIFFEARSSNGPRTEIDGVIFAAHGPGSPVSRRSPLG